MIGEALDDAVATIAAVRAASRGDDWAESADHFHTICGETLARIATLRSTTPAVAVDDDARFLRSFTGLPKHFNTRLTAIADRLQSLLSSVRVKDEALRDARLFVELVRVHWQNWHSDDEQQIAEAKSCADHIDAALSDQQGGE